MKLELDAQMLNSLEVVINSALKAEGIDVLQHVNYIVNSISKSRMDENETVNENSKPKKSKK